jgi:CIC family chloride channel protein
MVGAAAWRFMHGLPGFPTDPGPVIIICMIAMFGSIAHSPLAMLLMVGEMTGNLSLLAPAMAAVAIATLLVGDITIYKSQVWSRADSPAHRHRFAFPLLSALPVQRAVRKVPIFELGSVPVDALIEMQTEREPFAIVRSPEGALFEVTQADLRKAREEGDTDLTSIARPVNQSIPAEMTLDAALDRLNSNERRWLPVVQEGEVLGVVDAGDLLRSYRRATDNQVRPLSAITPEVAALELVVPASSPLAGILLRDAKLPEGARILTYEHDGETRVPDGSTILVPGDRVTVSVPIARRAAVFRSILGAAEPMTG